MRKHRQYLREFDAHLGSPAMRTITKRQVADYVLHLQHRLDAKGLPLAPLAVAKRLDSIRAFLSFCASMDMIAANPAAGIRAPTDTRPPSARSYMPLTLADVGKLLVVSAECWASRRRGGHPDRIADLQAALRVLVWTGCRPNEGCQLRRADVDLDARTITITNVATADGAAPRRTKNLTSVRIIPIHPRLLPVLKAHVTRSAHPLLFPSFEPKSPRASYSDALCQAWTDKLRPKVAFDHKKKVLDSLRHSFACEAERVGMPESLKLELMGHSKKNSSSARYVANANNIAQKRRWIGKMVCQPPEATVG